MPLPMIIETFWAIRRQEMARWSRSAGTVCWVIADELGPPRAPRLPLSHAQAGQQRDARPATDQRERHEPLRHRGRGSRALQHHGAGEPVAEHPAEEHRAHVGQRVEADDEAELRRAAAEVEDREGEGDRCDAAAEQVDRRAGDQPAERRVPEWVILPRRSHGSRLFVGEIFVNEIVRLGCGG